MLTQSMRPCSPSALEDLRRDGGVWLRLDQLGQGAMAATHLGIRRSGPAVQRVCLKEINPGLWFTPDFQEAFLREAEIAASLRHSNIVGVIDVDATLGRLVLELVEGVDLRTLVNKTDGRRLPADLVVLIATELCKAFAYAHSRTRQGRASGVVHRDLSAANVLISYAGEVKLTDFGLATIIAGEGEPHSTTVRGKFPYFSPEQSRSESLDGRSDLFALGVLCYELLAGRRPFDAGTEEATIRAICAGRHTPLTQLAPDAPLALVEFVERLLSTSRDDRYPDAHACLDVLEQLPTKLRCRDLGQLVQAVRKKKTLDVDVLAYRRNQDKDHDSLSASETRIVKSVLGARAWRWVSLGLFTIAIAAVPSWWFGARPTTRPVDQRVAAERAVLQPPTRANDDFERERDEQTPDPRATFPRSAASAVGASIAVEVPVAQSAERRSKAAASRDGEPATLRIGTLPLAQVWVDGELHGWPPVVVSLPAGRHTIAAGRSVPEVTRTVRLRAGQSARILLELEHDMAPKQLPDHGQTP